MAANSFLTDPRTVQKMYIDGQWVLGSDNQTREVINPANGEVIGLVTEGTRDDARKAVQAARRAFDKDGWQESKARDRAALLHKIADLLEQRVEEFASLDTLNNGKPLRESRYDVSDAVNQFRYYAGLCTKPHGITYDVPDEMQSMVVREPIGVVGQIIPWNYPLVMATQKIAPAIAAGCAIVIKPAEQTPLSLIRLFEIIDQVGFPPGVINLVLGAGETVGAELAENPLVDKVAFTGGTDTGIKIMKAAADTIKKVGLELGGKSPNIVFADADFETAVDYALYAIFANQGEVCSAGSRLLLEASIYDRFVEELVARAKTIKVGPGTDEETEMGPLITEEHMNRVLSYIETGIKEGATLLCGGRRLMENGLDRGFFVEPTIFTNTTPDMRIVQEEIFGPVLVIQTFTAEEEAIELANGTRYGLAGAVFTSDVAKAHRVIRKLRAGITWINTYHPTYNEAPWGGYKQSGIGRELGTYGFEEYLEIKQINVNLQVEPSGWFQKR
ncbi:MULTISPECIES: aldehyde dehydrogenase family protein [Brevibacillus]|jgi:betaine-aldehyde dehydrogenase|uniref:Aldehyde dehydrogenase n=1 Tax=Brevibacillus borstelensis AK1 TaxID=1300222 RepID=M8E270_9BACL|nr:aldehyde dehydrogenase family protein [Brevibacillus borstelensis]EMT53371.1 aldehyde dehydrogenase [Brevibacillus borstelensis AK1]KKX53230.1 betaine-aldehyde dehydrogenase [Brevibacillus borstelensis cifa_chp40]MBE5394229.1 aldehyde dehydrogenase family protein [Brevibacillus borstelensis]MCM3471572.1 aldehyde dehydrogenase family protein [Brevibacillus borstelensis]MED1745448.1 aldehyde dehydrogenase family protein [Brevibacillus borstelensis]